MRYTIRRNAYGRAVPIDRLLVTPSAAVDAFVQILAHEPIEVFGVLCLSTKRPVIAYHEVSRGTLDRTVVHPREVFKAALLIRRTVERTAGGQDPQHIATGHYLSALAAMRSTERGVMQVGLMRVAEARRISQALVTAHITDASWRSPSGVMVRASRVGQICRSAHCS